MEVITPQINTKLKNLIDQSYDSIKCEFNMTNSRINHMNIYHKDWSNNHCENMINLLHDIYHIKPTSIISLGWIRGSVDCLDQHFHIDYQGHTHTYFIPIVELNDLNGTEYVKFSTPQLNLKLMNNLLEMSDKYIMRDQIIDHLSRIDIDRSLYDFYILNSQSYSMVWMPNYVYHRGRKNATSIDKIMFQIVIGSYEGANISSNIKFDDSELDEELDIVNKLIKSRSLNEQ